MWETRRRFGLLGLLLGLGLFLAACNTGGTGGGNLNLTGVWEGSYTSNKGNGSGRICVELNQSNGDLTGKLYIAGRGYAGNVTGTVIGNDASFGVAGGAQYEGSFTKTSGSGTYTVGTADEGTWELQKTDKTSCGWAGSSEVNAFATALGQISGDKAFGSWLASFITVLPTADVKLGTRTAQGWWICIWEVDDRVNSTENTYAAAVGPDPDNASIIGAVAWTTDAIHQQTATVGGTPGLQAAYLPDLTSLSPTTLYAATTGTYQVTQDTDPSYSPANKILETPCASGSKATVYMTELTGHLEFTGERLNPSDTLDVRIPPSGDFENLGALHVVIESCP